MSFNPLNSPLAEALSASLENRLLTFITDAESEPVLLFSPEHRARSSAGDWYGEHVGKWLRTVSLAYARTGDQRLYDAMRRVVGALASWQEEDGYLGTYATEANCRFACEGAEKVRTWDLWIHANLLMGLLETPFDEAHAMARRIGDLIIESFPEGRSVLDQGNHSGLSSAILIEPMVRLGEERFVAFATRIVEEAEARGLALRSGGLDPSVVGTGKIYQLLWTLTGVARLGRVTGDSRCLSSAAEYWQRVSDNHLTPCGGPWGGVARHKEVFNAPDFFSPYGMVETCSSMSWMCLSHELLQATGEAKYAEAIERTLFNAILGAADPNGRDWAYFTFPNGPRHNTYHWACCRSSGAMALELGASMIATSGIDILTPGEYKNDESTWRVSAVPSGYSISYRGPETKLNVRVPGYLEGAAPVDGIWRDGDELKIEGQIRPRYEARSHTVDHHGQEVFRLDYVAYCHGPYALAAEPLDGDLKEGTLRLPRLDPVSPLSADLILSPAGGRPIRLAPYAELARASGSWRQTWFQVAWQ